MAGLGLTGFLQNLSGGEMIVIAIVALVVLGPERLPDIARSTGRMIHKLKTMTEGLQSEMRDVIDDPSLQPIRDLGELAVRPRQKLTEYALEAEAEDRSRREAAARAAEREEEAAADDDADVADAGATTDVRAEIPADAESPAEGGTGSLDGPGIDAEPAAAEPDAAEPTIETGRDLA